MVAESARIVDGAPKVLCRWDWIQSLKLPPRAMIWTMGGARFETNDDDAFCDTFSFST
eukprot:CAMPEP_0184691740 /NCGR_PEP_ID=MMETSP0313-20130426/492_1 /TAXON_ID=2792 /ORGANISM="Porphyridium aerugineum, Strain SAG 1380-2" /LENGTH=57 /DNA_ID=CAMNT_0027149499 /DNA_START=507 /DNA_END=677 /DNA_ORIENTATION=+